MANRSLFTQYELLLGQYCETRDGQTYITLTRDVMPALTMAQEEQECARPFRRMNPGQPTPMSDPRNPRYEEFKRVSCPRFYYFDHERDARETLEMRLREDPECRVSRVPSIRSTFRAGVEIPEGVRPPTMAWKGYAPPPLTDLSGVDPSDDNLKVVLVLGALMAAAGLAHHFSRAARPV